MEEQNMTVVELGVHLSRRKALKDKKTRDQATILQATFGAREKTCLTTQINESFDSMSPRCSVDG